MKRSDRYDVLIVGAGPAGMAAACSVGWRCAIRGADRRQSIARRSNLARRPGTTRNSASSELVRQAGPGKRGNPHRRPSRGPSGTRRFVGRNRARPLRIGIQKIDPRHRGAGTVSAFSRLDPAQCHGRGRVAGPDKIGISYQRQKSRRCRQRAVVVGHRCASAKPRRGYQADRRTSALVQAHRFRHGPAAAQSEQDNPRSRL